MFDFPTWRVWMNNKTIELRSIGLNAEYRANEKGLSGAQLSIIDDNFIASFRIFENGFVDYEIMDAATKKWVANEAMIAVTDQNFENVFGKFANELSGTGA